MRVAVIDVGSNTLRLLVAGRAPKGLAVVRERKEWVRLGTEIAVTGALSQAKLDDATEVVSAFAQEARQLGCSRIEVLVASPGRQAENAGELVRALERASAATVRVLRRDEEARLGFEGAVANADVGRESVAVCDVGGGSTQLAIGTATGGPVWLRSIDIGSLRLATQAFENDPPGKKGIAAARELVRAQFDGLAVPLPMAGLAVGGSARALRRLVGDVLGEDELREAVRMLRKEPALEVARRCGIAPERARTLAAGALILSEVQRRLATPFRVVRGGVREGAALELADELSAA